MGTHASELTIKVVIFRLPQALLARQPKQLTLPQREKKLWYFREPMSSGHSIYK